MCFFTCSPRPPTLSQRHMDLHVWSYPRPDYIFRVSSKSVQGFRSHGGVKIWPFPLLWLVAFTTACTTVQAVINIKSYMSFRLVPKSVTLNDIERRNGFYFAWFLRSLVILGAYCVKVVDRAITMDHLRLLCLVVNVCRETTRRPRYKFLADW